LLSLIFQCQRLYVGIEKEFANFLAKILYRTKTTHRIRAVYRILRILAKGHSEIQKKEQNVGQSFREFFSKRNEFGSYSWDLQGTIPGAERSRKDQNITNTRRVFSALFESSDR
jgi:hypothetical protein